jgi:glycosyltransferase involved in cell wall biosynthesis
VSDTLVFIPAWNEEASLPDVLGEARRELPGADLLVVDDGSTDKTPEVARKYGAEVVTFDENRGLRFGIAEGYKFALDHGYAFCGRLDADGQHPAAELREMLARVRDDECDVAVGSRFLDGSGEYTPTPERVVGTSLLRLLLRVRLGQPISDGTSGMYAVNEKALALLADPYVCDAPEVEALVRITDAKLRLLEVPVAMRQREHGASSFRGSRAVKLVGTIGLALFASEALYRWRHGQDESRLGFMAHNATRPVKKFLGR